MSYWTFLKIFLFYRLAFIFSFWRHFFFFSFRDRAWPSLIPLLEKLIKLFNLKIITLWICLWIFIWNREITGVEFFTKIVNSLVLFSINHFIYRPSSRINGSSRVSCFLPLYKRVFSPTPPPKFNTTFQSLNGINTVKKNEFFWKSLIGISP